MLSKHPDKCRFPHGHTRKVEFVAGLLAARAGIPGMPSWQWGRLAVMAGGRLSPLVAARDTNVEKIGVWMSGMWPGAAAAANPAGGARTASTSDLEGAHHVAQA